MSDDYIKREDAVRRIAVLMAAEAESDGCEDQPMDTYIEYASEDLADIPSADVAPVVRCKDCVHYRVYQLASDGETITDCAVMPCHPPENWYCSNAERKDDEL